MGIETGPSGRWALDSSRTSADCSLGADLQHSSSHPGWASTALIASAFSFVGTTSHFLRSAARKRKLQSTAQGLAQSAYSLLGTELQIKKKKKKRD